MRVLLALGVLVVLAVNLTSAARLSEMCRQIRRNGCWPALKDSGKVCGTDGKTYLNKCQLEKKACRLIKKDPNSNLQVGFFAPCEEQPQRQQSGGTGGEETVIGVGGAGGENEPGDTPDAPDAPDQPDAPEQNEPGDTPDTPDAPDQPDNAGGLQNQIERDDTRDGADVPDTPDQQDPGAQAYPDYPEYPEYPAGPAVTDAPMGTGGPAVAPGSDSSNSAGSSSSQEAGAGAGAGGAGGNGAGAGAGAGAGGAAATIGPTQLPPISPGLTVCPESCPEPLEREQVCATDGETYRSRCLLQQYICHTNATVAEEHPGPCNNTCGEPCSLVYEPVCGTDDLTYMSRCDLMRTACLMLDSTLQVAYNQECTGVAQLKGCLECDPVPDPVCSTNNITFRSECEFDRFLCIFDVKGLEIAYNGSCPDAPLVCLNYCEQINDPVCANDGVTYPNVCEVGVADCHAKQTDPTATVKFESFGQCPEGTPDPCDPQAKECELFEDPVCAQKGNEQVTYYNQCFFEKEVCFDPTIKFVSTGRCTLANPKPVRIVS